MVEQNRHEPRMPSVAASDPTATSPLSVPEAATIRPGSERRPLAGGSPAHWWRVGIIAVAIVAALLFALQMLGGWPGTDVQPGTPVAEPQTAAGPGNIPGAD